MKEAFANGTFGMIGLLFFFGLFVAVLVWVFRPSTKKQFSEHSKIPLKDDDHAK